jgi:hypothetical protein
VVAQIPPPLQTVQTGRGFEAIVICRAPEHTHGIKLLNVATKREITRRTFKVIGDHPIKGLIFENPITIEISPADDEIKVTNENEAYLSRLVSETETDAENIQPPETVETPTTLSEDDKAIEYTTVKTQLRKQKKCEVVQHPLLTAKYLAMQLLTKKSNGHAVSVKKWATIK